MLRKLARLTLWLLALAWLAGCVWFATQLPPAPRSGWQPPAGPVVVGFLGDAPWLVTCAGTRDKPTGPIRRWNIDTGESAVIHADEARFESIEMSQCPGIVQFWSWVPGATQGQCAMSLVDGQTGK